MIRKVSLAEDQIRRGIKNGCNRWENHKGGEEYDKEA